ncbi:HipA domain-containing protein [Xanthomonas translucens]|nr:HipA domain-containing protein [Xanthomonas translucens]MBC3972980.1 HipA domain-containing protein [Xanthomonas translucens pv. undulosa]QEN94984.1 hypothetical protein F0H33_17875 [Xanthomonas translucens pv. undulosa]QSQ42440.1 HipA domain-containing protein [Xanthomonas translucens pv. translucens]QSQ49712.1 HipA domain-containing protein [Xanthomonas translucens pv. undulosa]UJB14782.1 HipA domain-containing protein [Xanthomonas translucens pv. undulosa]
MPAAQRWADLLHCEQLAGPVLRAQGLAAAESGIVEADGRMFLQSTRFDRTPDLGRRGFVSLAALDAAYDAHGRIDWRLFSRQLQRDGWLDRDDARRLGVYGWFGALIGNNDMPLGNAGMMLADMRPLALAPAYDMLPMTFRPAVSGEVVERIYTPALPAPDYQDDWRVAASMALEFCKRVAQADAIPAGFRSLALAALQQLGRAVQGIG